MRGKETNSGATCATSRSRCASRLAISAEMVDSYSYVEVEVRVHAPNVTATSVSGISAPIVLTSQAPFDVAVTSQPEEQERTDEGAVRGHFRSELL
jgi:hypothetical protein